MTPEELAKPGTEHAHQRAFFCWCQQQSIDPRLMWAFAIPNGGERNKAVASRLRAEGVKRGVPDVFIPIPVNCSVNRNMVKHHGLFIEFKKPGIENHKNQGMSDHQVKWKAYLESQNFSHFVAHSWLTAVDATVKYLQ